MNNRKAIAITVLAWIILILGAILIFMLFVSSLFGDVVWGDFINFLFIFIAGSVIPFIILQGFAELIELLDNINRKGVTKNFNELSSNLKEVQKTLDNLDENVSKIKKSFPSISDEQ